MKRNGKLAVLGIAMATNLGLMATGILRQLSPEGSPLTVAIFFSAGWNLIRNGIEFKETYNTPDFAPVAPTPPISQLRQVTAENDTVISMHFRDAIEQERKTISIQVQR